MIYKLLTNEFTEDGSTIEHILKNRGIENVYSYINTTDADVANPEMLGKQDLTDAARILINTIKNDKSAVVIVDADCDGMTASALLINYLHDLFPSWVENNVEWRFHEGKSHGLADQIDYLEDNHVSLVLIPDAGSNDYPYIERLHNIQTEVVILDHHEAPHKSEYAVTINNQLCDYPNKQLSGVGVVWQFCRYLDGLLGKDYASNYLDLLATGLDGDMMSLANFETKHLVNKGYEPDNVKNPYIFGMWEKNKFKLGDRLTPMGSAFYIVPFINAICRSGTMEEKELIFNAMLNFKAFEMIPSTKRGHLIGEMERVVDAALRTSTNVKNRQTKAQDAGMEILENMIKRNDMLKHPALVFLLAPGEIDPAIRGLAANKIMAKYQRPVCVLTKTVKQVEKQVGEGLLAYTAIETIESYEGSSRGYDKSGIDNFKDICGEGAGAQYAAGHQSAFGLGVEANSISEFVNYLDNRLEGTSAEPIYWCDYIWTPDEKFGQQVIDIADMACYWGKDVDEPFVCIKGIHITADNFKVMKSNTIKIQLPNSIDIIKFGMTDDEINSFTTEHGYIEIDAICRCKINEWNFERNPQLELIDYNIIDKKAWDF